MDDRTTATARTCLDAAYSKALSFPEIIGVLAGAGFEGYAVDYRRNTTTYFLADGDSIVLDNPASTQPVAESFDGEGVAAQVRWAQANPPDYSYAAFCRNVKAMGCAGYLVSFPGRRVVYYGRTAETHVEHFPRHG
jgi:uncharacterized protein YbcV (DUF1398 family)